MVLAGVPHGCRGVDRVRNGGGKDEAKPGAGIGDGVMTPRKRGELMKGLTIATWNFQTDNQFSQMRADAFRRAMDEIKADVWVITEPLLTFSPGAEYRLVAHSSWAADIEKWTDARWAADRRWVALWSRLPARKVEVLREPDRMACLRIEQDGQQDVVIVGTVLPWASDEKWPREEGKGFRDA